jgi:hypothetical protein
MVLASLRYSWMKQAESGSSGATVLAERIEVDEPDPSSGSLSGTGAAKTFGETNQAVILSHWRSDNNSYVDNRFAEAATTYCSM